MAGERGAVLAITSAKGGVGKSVFAANFAVALLRETRGKVVLLDLDLTGPGDAALALGLPSPRRAASDLAPLIGSMPPAMLKGYLDTHSSGIAVMRACHRPEEARELTPPVLGQVVDFMAQAFDLVLMDLATGFGPHNQACLEAASHIFTLLTPDLMAINHTRAGLETLQGLGFSRQVVSVILNRHRQDGGYPPEVVGTKLGRPIDGVVPEAGEDMTASLTQGLPLMLSQPRHPYSKAQDELAAWFWSQGLAEGGGARRAPGQATEQAAAGLSQGQIDAVKLAIHDRLLDEMDLRRMDTEVQNDPAKMAELKQETKKLIDRLVDEEGEDITDRATRQRISVEIVNEALGLGPLEELLSDPEVTEIMCNGHQTIYVERRGRLELSGQRFLSQKHLRASIERIVAPLGRHVDELSPMVDARLAGGSRVNAVIAPLALDGPLLTIRKVADKPLTVEDLIQLGSLNRALVELMECCVKAHLNILVSGGTGSGKTTLLNVLSSYIPDGERIITIEDSAELMLRQRHVCRMESRPPSLEGTGEITIRDLVRNALRMRPDRIVVGECRGGEALDMLQAMNTGHDGSMTTIHANSPHDSMRRLETLVMFAGLDLPSRAVREQIGSAIHMIIHQSRLPDGSRKIMNVTEVTGLDQEEGVMLQEIFSFRQTGVDEQGRIQGDFVASGFIPTFMTTLEDKGFSVPREIFMESYL